MRQRTVVHVAGPVGAGKTAFIERLLAAVMKLTLCVRGERDPKAREVRESSPEAQPELRRYRKAGASDVALYRFARQSMDEFYMSAVMQNYSEAVLIEGDSPIDYVDLSVFVTPPPAPGKSLFRRMVRSRAGDRRAVVAEFAHLFEDPSIVARLFGVAFREALVAKAPAPPPKTESPPALLEAPQSEMGAGSSSADPRRWALTPGFEGIERAHLVVVNVRAGDDRRAAEMFLNDVARLRKDEEVFRDVVGFRGYRLPIMAVIADLSDPKDAGAKKAVARVKRATKRQSP